MTTIGVALAQTSNFLTKNEKQNGWRLLFVSLPMPRMIFL